ncbi:MAG: hypothetical protein R3305_03840, partial [Gammaproteobacteria bacterium]|nr:hypothetical protein [Gammaproteobacteria bacterium]
LRFAIAKHYLESGDAARAVEHARVAVELDADYSAGWRLLGQAQVAAGLNADAAASFERGIEVATKAGDRQVEKEMQVFLKRLRKSSDADDS